MNIELRQLLPAFKTDYDGLEKKIPDKLTRRDRSALPVPQSPFLATLDGSLVAPKMDPS